MADLSDGWKGRPPVQWMVQAYLGFGAKESPENEGEFDDMVGAINR